MDLNIKKCHVMRSSRRSEYFLYPLNIHLNNYILSSIREVKDLGIHFSSTLDFSNHISYIVNSASRTLGFIPCFSTDFHSIHTLRMLYITLVRPLLEYASSIWSPKRFNHEIMLEKVQHKFLRFCSYKLKNPVSIFDHDYSTILNTVNLETLSARRRISDHFFVFNLINNHIDCLSVLMQINFYVPERVLRSRAGLQPLISRSTYGLIIPVNRIIADSSTLYNIINFFNGSLHTFKIQLRRIIG